jgi:hypothetical protein
MKYETRETLLSTFGTLPQDTEGRELCDIHFKIPVKGETFLNDTGKWMPINHSNMLTNRPVAIYADTNRADGTPMSIAALPTVEGYRLEFYGTHLNPSGMSGATGHCYFHPETEEWRIKEHDVDPNGCCYNYALLYKIAQPTTLEDLIGDDYQKNFYLHIKDGDTWARGTIDTLYGRLEINDASIANHKREDHRWSHNPTTPYAEANEFVV